MYLLPIWKKREFYKSINSKNLSKDIILKIVNSKISENKLFDINLVYKINNEYINEKIKIKENNNLMDLFEKILEKTNMYWSYIYLGKNKCLCDISPLVRHEHILGTLNIHEKTYYCMDKYKHIRNTGIYPNCELLLE